MSAEEKKEKEAKQINDDDDDGDDDGDDDIVGDDEEESSMNPALKEPDAMKIAQRTSESSSSSSSGVAVAAVAPSVTTKRKKELLVEARKDRRKWIQRVPLPYTSPRDPNNIWSSDDRLYVVQSSLVCQKISSATKILSELYGLEPEGSNRNDTEKVAQRVEKLARPFLTEDDDKGLLFQADATPDEILAGVMLGKVKNDNDDETNEAVIAYHDFWMTLLKPECALLVEGMRNFLRNLLNNDHDTNNNNNNNNEEASKREERMAISLKQYLGTTYESLKSHVAWKDKNNNNGTLDINVRRSLESFVYGQLVQSKPQNGFFITTNGSSSTTTTTTSSSSDNQFTMSEGDWRNRLELLQFVNPNHLEIDCLLMNDDDEKKDFQKLLQQPVEAVLSIDRYFSPYEKLQRILAVYQGVNTALSQALNQNNNDGTSSSSKKLPSADDVLPTIILTVLCAKPTRLLWNLHFVDVFCPQEYLRGEAGYAYTNLYGAVQFLHDLDMDQPNLSNIDPQEFQKAVKERMEQTQGQIRQRQQEEKEKANLSKLDDMVTKATKAEEINVHDVREARLNGENVDLGWVLERQSQQRETLQNDENSTKEHGSPFTARLPNGFHRTYSFMGARPEDIRVSDLPKLLDEYKMLAHVTEQLLGERAGLVALEKQRKLAERQQRKEEGLLFGMGEKRAL